MLFDEDKKRLSTSQQADILNATNDYNKAYAAGDTAGMAQAADKAKGIRTGAGYTLDDSGALVAGGPGQAAPAQDYTRNIQNYYTAAEAQKKRMYKAKMEQAQSDYRSQLPQIARNYENVRNNVYASSRRDAFGNTEAMAAQGLGRSISNSPSSGYGETSRAMLNANMYNNLNQATIAEQDAKDKIAKAILDVGYTTSIEEANALANQKLAEANAVQNQWNTDRAYNEGVRQYDLNRADSNSQFNMNYGVTNRQLNLQEAEIMGENSAGIKTLGGKKLDQEITNDQWNKALAVWQTKGKAPEDIAKILGISPDDPTMQQVFATLAEEDTRTGLGQNAKDSEWNNAWKAASMGNFAPLQALGMDTSQMEVYWKKQTNI